MWWYQSNVERGVRKGRIALCILDYSEVVVGQDYSHFAVLEADVDFVADSRSYYH